MKKLIYILLTAFLSLQLSSCVFDTSPVNGTEDDDNPGQSGSHEPGQSGSHETEPKQEPDTIPFVRIPNIPEYKLPQEEFTDPSEKEASDIIDHAIESAIAHVTVMKDNRHSKLSYEYDEDADGYISKFSANELDLYHRLVSAAKNGQPFSISESEYGGDLKSAYFAIMDTLRFLDPAVASYVNLDANISIDMDLNSHYKDLFLLYYDPYQDPNYTVKKGSITQDEVDHAAALLDHVVKRIVRFMPEDLTTYDKYYYLAVVISEQTRYSKNSRNAYTAFGALISRKAVCEGYSEAFALLCREANLWVSYRGGFADNGKAREGHAWNMIKLEDGIYNVDVTWSDGSGNPSEIEWYDYFIKSDELFEDNGHEPETGLASTGKYAPNPYEE